MSCDARPIALVDNLAILHSASGRTLVEGVGFTLDRGRCLGIVGESGSGKTLVCRALLGLLPPGLRAEGRAAFEGVDMPTAAPETARRLRGTGMAAILQQPMTAFDPLSVLGAQLVETIVEKLVLPKSEAEARIRESLNQVQLPETALARYPHQLSGGMLQRCMIALTLALNARLVVADEPTTALDAHNQYEVLERFRTLRERGGLALIFVSHDLGAVQRLADEVMVMRGGRCVEYGDAAEVFNRPRHEYTRYLVANRLALTRGFQNLLEAGHAR